MVNLTQEEVREIGEIREQRISQMEQRKPDRICRVKEKSVVGMS